MELSINPVNLAANVFKGLTAVLLVIVVFLPKKKGYAYNSLDQKGIIFNIVLSVLYVPLSIAGIFTLFFWDAPTTDYSTLKLMLLDIVTGIGFSIPVFSLAAIVASIVARKRGKSKFSFIIQFLPIPIFVILLAFIFLMCNA